VKGRGTRLIGVCLSLAAVALAAAVLHARDTSGPLPVSGKRFMYLQSGKTADRLFLSFDALAADVYWIRTIQHYGRDRKSLRTVDRFQWLQPLLDLTTTLDPRFNIAYRFGAIFLSIDPPDGPGRVDQAMALLEKGLASNPKRWQYAHDIGFIHYWYTGDYPEASRWFSKAAAMPGAPDWIGPLAALTLAQGGDRQGARRLLTELLTADESYIRSAAERSLAQLETLDRIDAVSAEVEKFHAAAGRYPLGWDDMIRARIIPGQPLDSSGAPLEYNPETHAVTVSSKSTLFPLPRSLQKP